MSVVVVGANHRTTPLELLERMAIPADRLPKMLHAIDGGVDTSEVVVLATCNRTEVYLVAERFHGAYAEVRDFFSDLTFLPPERFADSLYVHYDDQAIRHLFEVSAGLDSAVPGEHEILGQVRSAWDVARSEGTSRRTLNLLFRHSLQVGKRARTETSIARHVTSVSQAAVILGGERLAEVRGFAPVDGASGGSAHGGSASVESVGGNCPVEGATADECTAARARAGLAGARAVVVGAGAMGRGVAAFLADAGVAELVVANRTLERAEELVDRMSTGREDMSARAVRLADLPAVLGGADVVFGATGSPDVVVDAEHVVAALAGRSTPLLAVDIAMPRDIDPSIAGLDGVELLDMDAVAAFTEAGIAGRRREVAAVRSIVDAEVERFAASLDVRSAAPVITALRGRAEELRCRELARAASSLSDLTEDQRAAVEAVTRGLVAKLLHEPTVRLRDSAGSGRGERLTESVRELFDLDPEPDVDTPSDPADRR